MVREAEQYADEDRRRREQVESRNQADGLVYSTEKFLADNTDKVPDDVRAEVQEAIDSTKKALEGEDTEAIKSAADHLAAVSQKMGSAIYAAAQPSASAGEGFAGATGDGSTDSAGSSGGDEDVVDAEIVDEGDSTGK
jgi:molecular chaperone DnaK